MNKRGKMLAIAMLLLATAVLVFISFSFTGHDIVSLNSGGGNSTVVSSLSPIMRGSFFIQIPVSTSASSSNPTTASGGGAGGVATGGISSGVNLNVTEINVTMLNSTNRLVSILVTNTGASSVDISISQSNLTNLVLLQGNSSFTLNSSQATIVNFLLIAPASVGIYTGTLTIGGITIPVSINVKNQPNLFDSRIVVLNPSYTVEQGNKLRTQVTLIPRGPGIRIDATLNYTITDSSGRAYFNSSETLLVDGNVTIKRNFDTGKLPFGNYTISLQVYYPEGIAPSSAQFEVAPKTLLGKIIYYSVFSLVGISVLVVFILILRTRRRKDNKSQLNKSNV